MRPSRIHFHTFDALRFFAFLKVYLFHVPIAAGAFPVFAYLKQGGGIGVLFFFVLSGFLITYILTNEKVKHGKIRIGRFMIRRILRIWPIFYLILLIGFLLPDDFLTIIGFNTQWGGYEPEWYFSFLFLENYNMIIQDRFPLVAPFMVMWSLCIEEHFYILWVFLLAVLPIKRVPIFLGASICLAITCRWLYPQLLDNQMVLANDLPTNLDLFALGGLLGFATATRYQALVESVQRIPISAKRGYVFFLLAFVIFGGDLLGWLHVPEIVHSTLLGIVFVGLLVLFIPSETRFKISDSNLLSSLGRISYGLYLYHLIFICAVLRVFKQQEMTVDDWPTLLLFIALTLGGTLLAGTLSYRYIEQPFFRLKPK